ncbi:MAG: RagB/SusD family nutrient uptake outer membrane protein [Bacteroidota bacterium]|nr:RagB/SusD family nutrient uptake outer membrane protein [Bacteroidota bacterium]
MKRIFLILPIIGMFLASCNDSFLERYPQTSIAEANFFKSVEDLQTFSNQFYDYWGPTYWDRPSDNITVYKNGISELMYGTLTQYNATGWDWGILRSVNYFLENSKKVTGDKNEILKYQAIGHFARAKFYFDKIKKFSDVPWYSNTLNTNDSLLYKAADTRELIADSIIADLEFASQYLPDQIHKTLLSKWVAYTELARFCLYEGTHRKYHAGEKDLHVTKAPEYFYNKAVEASNAVMQSGRFSIHTTGNPNEDYGNLFNGELNLSANPEILMYTDYERGKRTHGAELVLAFENGISRTMADTYLYTDGTFVPQSVTDTLEFSFAFKDRDPRFKQSIMFPGYIYPTSTTPNSISIGITGGYGQIKFMPKQAAAHFEGCGTVYTDLPLYRYAEVLLINAEALAELGKLTQTDLDNTINKLRKRAGVTDLKMNPPIDPVLNAFYNNITSSQKAELLEVRRERNVELFAEGFRFDDLMRWKMGKVFEQKQQGIYVPKSGMVDMTGDGKPDYFISDNDPGNITGVYKQITSNSDIPYYLEFGDHGHVMFKIEQNSEGVFIEPKHYYRPIPYSQILLNPKLKQLFGWDN